MNNPFERDLIDLTMIQGDGGYGFAFADVAAACTKWLKSRGISTGQLLTAKELAARKMAATKAPNES